MSTKLTLITLSIMLLQSFHTAHIPSPGITHKWATSSDLAIPHPSLWKQICQCFQCGSPGHMPAECTAETTLVASHHSLLLVQMPRVNMLYLDLTKSCSALYGPRTLHAPLAVPASIFHGCSLCGGSSHGARECRIQSGPMSSGVTTWPFENKNPII